MRSAKKYDATIFGGFGASGFLRVIALQYHEDDVSYRKIIPS
ncbi:MAG TPA: hypothetical protein VF074_16345 [Pyrinomonadaceae bacterium]